MFIRCAWCGKALGEKDGEGQEGTSDGICDACLLHHFPHIYELIKDGGWQWLRKNSQI